MKLNIKGCRSFCKQQGIENYVELAGVLLQVRRNAEKSHIKKLDKEKRLYANICR